MAYTARNLRRDATPKQRLELALQRQRLIVEYDGFHKKSKLFLTPAFYFAEIEDEARVDLGEEWDQEEDYLEREGGDDEDPSCPEKRPISLPSTLGLSFLKSAGKLHLAEKERQLRIGQMNDALLSLRIAIGYKSYLYYAKVRNASSMRARLRSFDDVKITAHTVTKHVRQYMQARKALFRLFDTSNAKDKAELKKLKKRYKEIAREDLKVNTAVLEPFAGGLRDIHASWIWHFEDPEESGRTGENSFVIRRRFICSIDGTS